ncbi:MAG: hypothetical protein AB9903_23740 [Vulcanimicrobiota bacterium]
MRIIAFCLLTLLFINATGCGKVSNDYFPLEKGTSWRYSFEGLSKKGNISMDADAEEALDEGKGTIIKWMRNLGEDEEGQSSDRELYVKKSDSSVIAYKRVHPIIGYIETNLNPPQCILKLPLKEGESWQWEGKIFGMKSTAVFKTEGRERITLSDKSYNAVKVTEQCTIADGRTCSISRWYAPGKGMVKQESKTMVKNEYAEQAEMKLESFSPAKVAK